MTAVPLTPTRTTAELARDIASDIRAYGHFRGVNTKKDDDETGVRVCIISNSYFYGDGTTLDARVGLIDSIIEVAGINTAHTVHNLRRQAVVDWNDHSETEHVLEVLDKISAKG